MKNIELKIWDRQESFNGVDLDLLQKNLPDPCILVYVDGIPIGAEDANIRSESEVLEIYNNMYNSGNDQVVESPEDTILRLSLENEDFRKEMADINYTLMMGGLI